MPNYIALPFPHMGINRGGRYSEQFNCPNASNVRPRATLERRRRGGSRPGLAKKFAQQVGGGSYKIRFLADVQHRTSGGQNTNTMVASANGDIWTGTSTSLANISEVNKLSSAQSIMADVSQEKLWIADYDTTAAITNRTDGVVLANVSAGTPLTSSAGGFDATNKDTHVVTIEDLGSGVDEVQVATITGSPTGGTFRLKFLDEETNSIAYNASAAAVEQALEGLISIGLSNVAVTGSAGGAWTITFGADLGDQPLARIQLGTNSLTGGSSPSVAITQSTAGQAAPSRIGSYEISTIDSDTQYNLKYSPDPLNLPTSIQFSVQRSPKYYDPKTNATYHWVAKPGLGFVPVGSPFVVTWRDRAVMIDSATPWILRMSRQGDFQDWLLTDDAGDKQRPVFL